MNSNRTSMFTSAAVFISRAVFFATLLIANAWQFYLISSPVFAIDELGRGERSLEQSLRQEDKSTRGITPLAAPLWIEIGPIRGRQIGPLLQEKRPPQLRGDFRIERGLKPDALFRTKAILVR